MGGNNSSTNSRFNKDNLINNGLVSVSNNNEINNLSNKPVIEIHLAAKNIIKLDVGSESDPMCILFIQKNGKWLEYSRTEVVWDNANPIFVKTFKIDYIFEEQLNLRFSVYHCKNPSPKIEDQALVGYHDTTLQLIASNLHQNLEIELQNDQEKNFRGKLILSAEQMILSSHFVEITPKIFDFNLVRSIKYPFLVFSRPSEGGTDFRVYRTEVLKNYKTGLFQTFVISKYSFCGGDDQTPISISLFNFVSGKTEELIGNITLNLYSLIDTLNQPLELKNQNSQTIGKLMFIRFLQYQRPTFLDYLNSGIQLNLITAIDFTGSNGAPSSPSSLHYNNSNILNQYQQCIKAVGEVICPYDNDQLFPVYGFGAYFNGYFSHCYPLTFSESNPNVEGLEGILNSYSRALNQIQLHGPTHFSPVIRNATNIAIESFQENKTYTILLIITDGEINDMKDTIDAIVDASNKPLSIIIVGVGNANFDNMDILDADDVPLKSSKGVLMKRDIVQFVPFRNFSNVSKERLAAEVLEEVPRQVDEYCRYIGFKPEINQN